MTTLAFDPSARLLQGGRVLVGGHPARMLRLTPAGARLVGAWRAGAPVGASEGAQRLAQRLIDAGLAHPRPSDGGVTPGDVAVVIPALDRAAALAECLARIGPCREIVIVDDGSSDPSAIAAVAASPDERALPVAELQEVHGRAVRVVRRDVSGGPAAARNAGLAATDAPFVAFVDSDTLPTAGWLEPLLAHFGDPRLAAVAPRVRVPAGSSVLARYEAARSPLDLGPDPGIVGPGRRVGYVPAAALVVRRAALTPAQPDDAVPPGDAVPLSPIPPFDEAMRFGEDVDLVWRLQGAGWTVRYEPASVVEHPHRASVRGWLAQRVAYGSSAGPLAKRHPGRMRHVVLPRAAFISWGLAVAGRPKLALAASLLDLRHVRRRELAPLAIESQARAARQIADAAWRAHAPLLLATKRGRRFLAAALVAGAAVDYCTRRPELDPARFTALRAADDLAYAAGVWAGCLRARTAAPLIPGAAPRRRTR